MPQLALTLDADLLQAAEDGLQYCAARTVPAISAIVTRGPKGFGGNILPVLTPPEALARLAQ